MKKIAALIVAAGRGARASADATPNDKATAALRPKQFAPLGSAFVLTHSVGAFLSDPRVTIVQVVISADGRDGYNKAIEPLENDGLPKLLPPAIGGVNRQESVLEGLRALESHQPDIVLIHDGARPFVSPDLIGRVTDTAIAAGGAIPGLPVIDTVKRIENELVGANIDRDGLFTVQTPQGFHFNKILEAHEEVSKNGISGLTDDAAVARHEGMKMQFVTGDADNLKITYPGDLARAEAQVAEHSMSNKSEPSLRPSPRVGPWVGPRVGIGFDVHEFEDGDHVILCGVEIPFHKKLKGHSDADVALHALTDALYGAISDGDIGTHFPPSDSQWRGVASTVFLAHAAQRVKDRGGQINNVDLTIICEQPKITPHREVLTAKLSSLLKLDRACVSVKATTTEGLGFTGRGEGIAAQAIVLIEL